MKTSELKGVALDWAVAKCEGAHDLEVIWSHFDNHVDYCFTLNGESRTLSKGWAQAYTPTTNWAQGGPIIEREVITLIHPKYECWTAHKYDDNLADESYTLDGETPLIAAMRCYVTSKLGDEVEIPEELKNENNV